MICGVSCATLKCVTNDLSEQRLAALMKAALEGDRTAYAELLTEMVPIVRRIARGRVAGAEDLDDVVQDVLLSVHQVRHTYDPARPFMPWLNAIARNRLVDAQRRMYRRTRNEVAVDFLPETFSGEPTKGTEDVLSDRNEVHDALVKLPIGQRRAVELLKLQELSLQEASKVSGLSVGSLKVSLHRAMISLRKMFDK